MIANPRISRGKSNFIRLVQRFLIGNLPFQAFGLLSVILLFVDVYVNSKEVRRDNYLQGPTAKKEILIDYKLYVFSL